MLHHFLLPLDYLYPAESQPREEITACFSLGLVDSFALPVRLCLMPRHSNHCVQQYSLGVTACVKQRDRDYDYFLLTSPQMTRKKHKTVLLFCSKLRDRSECRTHTCVREYPNPWKGRTRLRTTGCPAHSCHSSTQEMEARRSEAQGHLELHRVPGQPGLQETYVGKGKRRLRKTYIDDVSQVSLKKTMSKHRGKEMRYIQTKSLHKNPCGLDRQSKSSLWCN